MPTGPEYVLRLISHLRKKHIPDNSGAISLTDWWLSYMNEYRLQGQNTILMRLVEVGKGEDVDFLLKIKGLEVNRRNEKGETAADISWRKNKYDILLMLLEKDSKFPKGFSIDGMDVEGPVKDGLSRLVEDREKMHQWIREGCLKSVEEYTKNRKPSVFYGTDNVSAMYRAIEHKRMEICSHLSCLRPSFRIPEMVIKERNWPQNWDKSHILKLVHATRFLEEKDREEGDAVIEMYLKLEMHEEISWLMRAIQFEDFEVYFEIKSEYANPEEFNEFEKRAFGITNRDGRIYIGGRGITTKEGYGKVHGVFAHEICHFAMMLMYENRWNPYHHDDKKRKEEFRKICDLYNGKEGVDTVIKEAYESYKEGNWEGELIVRVPHIIGMYNEGTADQIFKAQIPDLRNYYMKYVLPDCKEFSDPDFHSIPLRQIKELSEYHGVVCGLQKRMSPFIENFLETNKYEDHLIPFQNCTILLTSNPKLCAMHIFHEQKRKFPLHAEKRCLAFHFEFYIQKDNLLKILEAFKCKICKTIILLVTDKNSAWEEGMKYISKYLTEEKQVIIVTSVDIFRECQQWKMLSYQWNDLSENCQKELLSKVIMYQGRRTSLEDVLDNCKASEVMNSDVLWHIMSQDKLSIGGAISSDWNQQGLYIERTFVRLVYQEDSFQVEKVPSHHLFVTGFSELRGVMKKRSQLLFKDEDRIEEGKYVFISGVERNNAELFQSFFSRNASKVKQVFWIHYTNGKHLFRESLRIREDLGNYFAEDNFKERTLLTETDGTRVVLVADDPGTGKSTALRSVMEKMKEKCPEKLICSVNFSEHANEFASSESLHSLNEFLQRVCKINNPLEKAVFQAFIGIPRRIVIFFDGFDEMSEDSQFNTIKLLQLLRNETQIQMWISTRKQERLALEEELNTVAYFLKECSHQDQCTYLNRFWVKHLISLDPETEDLGKRFQEIARNLENCLVKCEGLKSMKEFVSIHKENEEEFLKKIINFSDYSTKVINTVTENILKGKLIVPLWLWMMANIILDSNLKIPEQQDRSTFYNDFMDKKVDSYLRVRCKIGTGLKSQEREFKRRRKCIFQSLWRFSVKVMQSEHYEQDLEKDDLEELLEIGLLKKEGEDYHFFHMTFAEFFFSQMILKEIESGKLSSVNAKLLSDVLLKESFREVRLFLDDFLDKDESQSLSFPKILLKEFDLFKTYSEFCSRTRQRIGFQIWRRIFRDCEKHMKESVDECSISKFLNLFPFRESNCLPWDIMDVLNSTLTDRMLFIIIDSWVDVSHKLLFRCLGNSESKSLTAIISIFEKVISYKKSFLRPDVSSTDYSLGNIEVGLEIFKNKYTHDYMGGNIYHVSAMSGNSDAFLEILRFASKYMKGEVISKSLQITNRCGDSILHLMIQGRRGKVVNELMEIQTVIGKFDLNKLLAIQNIKGENLLHNLRCLKDPGDAVAVLEQLERAIGEELFRQLLFQVDGRGLFPISNANLLGMKPVLDFMTHHLKIEDVREMLTRNKACVEEFIRETDCILKDVLYLEKVLGGDLFQGMLLSKGATGGTRLHWSMRHEDRCKLLLSDLEVYASFPDGPSPSALLSSQDKYGYTFLHYWAAYYMELQDVDILHELHSILSPDKFQHLLNIRNANGETFVHKYGGPLSELMILNEFLGKEKFIELVTARKCDDGGTRLHCIYYSHCVDYDLLFDDLRFYAELLDESSLRDFVLTKDRHGKTFCSFDDFSDISSELKSILPTDVFKDLQIAVESFFQIFNLQF